MRNLICVSCRGWRFGWVLGLFGIVTLGAVWDLGIKPVSAADSSRAADLNPVTFHAAPNHAPLVLVGPGQTARIILAPGASATLHQAVQDLIECVHAATGVTLLKATSPVDGPAIVIGDMPESVAAGLAGEKMAIEGFAIRTAANRVFIAGNDQVIDGRTHIQSNGTAWGVYEFCERFVGVRWYWPDVRGDSLGVSIPKRAELVVAPVWLSDAPVFRKREIWPSGGPAVAPADVDSHHRRLRSADTWPARLRVHAPHDFASAYEKTRPEIFQLRSDGQRDFDMLCYGHPHTLATYLEQIESQTKSGAKIAAGLLIVDGDNITVSPADMSVACTCEHCRALWDPDGGQFGTASRVVGTFVAKLGAAVKNRWPEKTIVYLPYKNYTLAPRDVTFPGNVEVQICGMPGLAQHKEPAIDMQEQKTIDAWMRISGRKIQNWHYDCWPEDRTAAAYFFPHTIQAHYRANRDKTVGSFINGEKDHWPRQHVSLYVWMKVLWNPEFNVDAAVDEFCRRMYGPAAGTMRQLVQMQIDGWEKSRWPGAQFSAGGIYGASYPRADVVRMEQLLNTAFEQAGSDQLVKRRLEYVAGPLRAFFQESKDYAEGTGRQTLDVYQVAEEPVIDGKLDDACWKDIQPVRMIRALDEKNRKPTYDTELKAVWTRRGVTFGFRMAEPAPEKLARDIGADSRDAALLWWNDNVELFLDVTGKRTDYYQFIVNPNGAIFDSHGKNATWTATGMRTAAFVGRDFWSLEVFLPYDAFEPVPRPNTGTLWFGNFTRHRVTDRSDREMQRLNTTFAGPSNNESAFGPIRFIER